MTMRSLLEREISDAVIIGHAIQIQNNEFIGTGQTALVEFRDGKTDTAVNRHAVGGMP